jgi:hypothetical protein
MKKMKKSVVSLFVWFNKWVLERNTSKIINYEKRFI